MKKIFLKTCLIFICTMCFGCAADPSIRAKEFTKNAYNGNNMQADEWFTKSGQSALNQFGGINDLVRYCSNEAKRNQGLKEINIISIKQENKLTLIETEIVFNNGTKKTGEDAWINENGKWKMAPKENNINNK
jgi:hypothetical protein